MLWIVNKGQSHAIVGCNIHNTGTKHQLWVERVNGKSLLITETDEKADIDTMKEAIDFAIEHGEPALRFD